MGVVTAMGGAMRAGGVWMGMAAGLATLLHPATGRAQFSPGHLAHAHASIDGPTQCFQCHEPRKSTTAGRCLNCHREVGARLAAGSGFHGHLPADKRRQCGTCHADHGGTKTVLIVWPGGRREAFDHGLTGFALTGKHISTQCDACHKPDLIRAADVEEAKNLQLATTHLGLSTRCVECHKDPHAGQFASRVTRDDCAACHVTAAWKRVTFDHATARFPLAGSHARVACAKCHYSEAAAGARVAAATPGAMVRYRPLGKAACAECHPDPHANRFGNDCAQCHSAESWHRVVAGRFDHERTRYPLTGRHATVACERCHWLDNAAGARVVENTAGAKRHYRPIAFEACTTCHADPHQKRYGMDCARCHATVGWKDITAGGIDHDKTRFPLRGRHIPVACEKCHKGRDFKQALAFDRCTVCHADAHRGELATRADRGACESCHTVDGFTPAHFDAEAHAKTQFPLADAHRAVACVTCHAPKDALGAKAVFHFKFADEHCAACHADPHAGQFAAKTGGATDCARCHTASMWRLSYFDHAATRFPLDGAHSRAACAACHRSQLLAGQSVVRYRPLDTACRSCHSDPPRAKRVKGT